MSSIARMQTTPARLLAAIPSIGGRYKVMPEYFVVDEVPAYELSGEGEHCFISTRRTGMTTQELIEKVAASLDSPAREIGYAGMKDRQGVCSQWLSVMAQGRSATDIRGDLTGAGLDVGECRFHGNKLRLGHLRGNRFDILVRGVDDGADTHARATFEALSPLGFLNWYGAQRFGRDGRNAETGLFVLSGRSRMAKWKRKLMLSALQSALFNAWLHARTAAGSIDVLLEGDVAKKRDTGGLFDVDDVASEQERFQDGAITCTGPMFGSKMRAAALAAGEIEEAVLKEAGLTWASFQGGRLSGTRRPARVVPQDVEIEMEKAGLRLRFFLPKGTYATTILDELGAAPSC